MTKKPELFGTDGIRGVAGEYPLDRSTVRGIGRALGTVLARAAPGAPVRVVLGEDTRESSGWISRVLAAGLDATGAEVAYAGVITTPAVALLTRQGGFSAGVMVSASHNPYEDNGIKVISSTGMKLTESMELEVEEELGRISSDGRENAEASQDAQPALRDAYIAHLLKMIPSGMDVSRYRVVADCAHGAASRVIPELFKKLGVQARILNAEPTGRNINVDCGSLHPQAMAETTRSISADLGVAFDGDADRAIFATRQGRIADGDHVLYASAKHLQRRGLLKGGAVVGTLMTNLGLELALAQHGIELKRTAVGDKYVLEEMLRSGINLGGEPSGHIIYSDLSIAGDGVVTLLQVLRLLEETHRSLEEVTSGMKPFPQEISNVRVREKPTLEAIPEVAHAVAECQREYGQRGRVVVRYSGTEPLARVMVEAEDAELVHRHAARIAMAIESAIGERREQER